MRGGIYYLLSTILIICCGDVLAQWDDLDPYLALQDHQALFQHPGHGAGMDPGPFGDDSMLRRQQQLPRYKDFITLENPPTKVKNNHILRMRYQCKKPVKIILFMGANHRKLSKERLNSTISLFNDSDVIFFRKQWDCSPSPYEAKASVPLVFPQEMLQRPSILHPKVWTLEDVKLKIALVGQDMWQYLTNAPNALRDIYELGYENSQRSLMAQLKSENPYCRSEKSLEKCYTWPYQILNSLFQETPPQSIPDDMAINLLPYPVMQSDETAGVPRNFRGTSNPETNQINAAKKPRLTISATFYMASPCEHLCGVFQHIDENERYGSPVIFISQEGRVMVQSLVSNNNSYVVKSEWQVPVREWVRIDVQQFGALVNITMRYGENFSQAKSTARTYMFPVTLDYKKGYFTAGPSLHARSFRGIFGSMYMWRNMIKTSDQISPPPPDHPMFSLGIEAMLDDADEVHEIVDRRWEYLKGCNDTKDVREDICLPYFLEIIQPPRKEAQNQTPASSQPLPKRLKAIESQLIKCSKKRRKKNINMHEVVGKRLYKRAMKLLGNDGRMKNMAPVIDVLENASILFHGPSIYLLYTIYENGFGVNMDREKAQTYIRLGAMLADRMSVKTIAYKHFLGTDGFPEDMEVAYWYFVNAANRAQADRISHEEQMTEVNRVRLTDERRMKSQTAEDEDLFEWLKHQANTGVKQAKRNFAQFLYWGKQGLKRNLKAAFEYYEKAAVENADDPDALYDYGITLIKGHGTEVNEEKGLEALEQAAAKESPNAFNTLGWYYIKKEGMKEKAVEYFEKASALNNIDATYNLGHMHFSGDYPGQDRDMTKAFQYFYKAAGKGHVHSCTRVSYMFATGIENFLLRNIQYASMWARPVSDLSPHMGEILREALQAYRAKSWAKSALLYLSVAESGFEPAVFNIAYLCDDVKENEIRTNIKKDCVWRFWNESAHHHFQTPAYAQNKMGDYFYYGINGTTDIEKAVFYYSEAAKKNEAQALFNLAFILEEHGDVIKNETFEALRISQKSLGRREDTILELYQKCSSINTEANSMPCYMGYLRMKLIILWKYTPVTLKIAMSLIVVTITTLLVYASSLLRPTRRTDELVLSEQGNTEEDPFGSIRTHIFPEEVIEHELSRHNSRTGSDETENIFKQDIQSEQPLSYTHDNPFENGWCDGNRPEDDKVLNNVAEDCHESLEHQTEVDITGPNTQRNSVSTVDGDDSESKKDL